MYRLHCTKNIPLEIRFISCLIHLLKILCLSLIGIHNNVDLKKKKLKVNTQNSGDIVSNQEGTVHKISHYSPYYELKTLLWRSEYGMLFHRQGQEGPPFPPHSRPGSTSLRRCWQRTSSSSWMGIWHRYHNFAAILLTIKVYKNNYNNILKYNRNVNFRGKNMQVTFFCEYLQKEPNWFVKKSWQL